MSGQIAAFFDLDGALLPPPSLERRFYRRLLDRREIPAKNYFLWLREALSGLPGGIGALSHANKMYLSGVKSFDESSTGNPDDSSGHTGGHQNEGEASKPPKHNPRSPLPRFFSGGLDRVTCHAMLGHLLVIVSATLEPLARVAARALEGEIAARGFATRILVHATRLKEINGKWTGEILGEAMFGEAKARVVASLAEQLELDLSRCWAYGDRAADRSMLAAVGNPVAMNPGFELARIARKRGWPILRTAGHIQEAQDLVSRAEPCA